jgi:guanylate kinase
MGDNNFVLLITGPNAVGKGSLVNAVLASDQTFRKVIRHATRAPGIGETPGDTYHFVSEQEFLAKAEKGVFIEYFKFPSGYYGTSKEAIVEPLKNGFNSVVEMDVDAARDVKKYLKLINIKCVDVFVIPITIEEFNLPDGTQKVINVMFERIRKRGRGFDASEVELETRRNFAERWLTEINDFSYVLSNPDGKFDQAVIDLNNLIQKQKV